MGCEFLFRSQPYLREVEAEVTGIERDGGIRLNRTVFYAQSGGQPGDRGFFETANAQMISITNTVHPGDKADIAHLPLHEDHHLSVGDVLTCKLDWERRLKLMRMHTALHLLSLVFAYPVTGGSIGEDKGRLDFDMPEIPTNLSEISARLNALILANHTVSEEWISQSKLAANPQLVKTMMVKPPADQSRVRLIRIGSAENAVDLQPCGGTHVASTDEIGPVSLGKIQKKGKQNRRIYLHFAPEEAH